MKLNKDGDVELEHGEPAMRSCWECNPAHKHLQNTDYLHWCFDCGRYWIFGEYMDVIAATEESFLKFFLDKGVLFGESTWGKKCPTLE